MRNSQRNINPIPRRYNEEEWPEIRRNDDKFIDYVHKEETKRKSNQKTYSQMTSGALEKGNFKKDRNQDIHKEKEDRKQNKERNKKEMENSRTERDKRTNWHNDYDHREEEIGRERYGVVTKYCQDQRINELSSEEKGRPIWIDRIDKMMSTFEEAIDKMTKINEGFLRIMEEERREMRRIREGYDVDKDGRKGIARHKDTYNNSEIHAYGP